MYIYTEKLKYKKGEVYFKISYLYIYIYVYKIFNPQWIST